MALLWLWKGGGSINNENRKFWTLTWGNCFWLWHIYFGRQPCSDYVLSFFFNVFVFLGWMVSVLLLWGNLSS